MVLRAHEIPGAFEKQATQLHEFTDQNFKHLKFKLCPISLQKFPEKDNESRDGRKIFALASKAPIHRSCTLL